MNKPKAKDYQTDDGMHTAMNDWACKQDKKILSVSVLFDDGSVFNDTFPRSKKSVQYKLQDGEIYTVDIDSAKFVNSFMSGDDELSSREFKEAFVKWVGRYKQIKWELI